MEFMQTQTCRNLARSFAGESQARQRYTQYADQARKEGLAYLARIFEEAAANEQIHAQEFLEKLQKYGRQPIENIDISAGYPYTLGVTMENLLEAAKGENEESVRVYPGFAKTAREEGYADIASLWENIARIEAVHRDVFLESYEQMQTERLYKKEHPIVWRCLNCGFVMLSKEAFRVCPVCGKDRGWAEGDIQTRRLGATWAASKILSSFSCSISFPVYFRTECLFFVISNNSMIISILELFFAHLEFVCKHGSCV